MVTSTASISVRKYRARYVSLSVENINRRVSRKRKAPYRKGLNVKQQKQKHYGKVHLLQV